VVPGRSALLQSRDEWDALRTQDDHLVIALVGTKDYVEERGFFIHECPVCLRPRVFSVADTRRKLTIYLIPTVPVRSQQVMECLTCHGRWAVPEASQRALAVQLVSLDEVADQMRQLEQRSAAMLGGRGPNSINGRTLYQTLQVDPAADPEVIEAAYRRLALKHHPDRSPDANAPDRMRELNAARTILLDPTRRRAYDAYLGIPEVVDALRADDV
jgi:hypothetical protein